MDLYFCYKRTFYCPWLLPPSLSRLLLCAAIGGALCSLSRLSHSMSEVMIQGAATANMASAEDGQSELFPREQMRIIEKEASLKIR